MPCLIVCLLFYELNVCILNANRISVSIKKFHVSSGAFRLHAARIAHHRLFPLLGENFDIGIRYLYTISGRSSLFVDEVLELLHQ